MNSFDQMIPILKQNIPLYLTRGYLVNNEASNYYLQGIRKDKRAESVAIKRQEKIFYGILEAFKESRLIRLKRIDSCIFTTDYAILD
jgi:hypothetical protein